MMPKKMVRKRVTGRPTPEQLTHMRESRKAALEEVETTKAESRSLISKTVGLPELIQAIRDIRIALGLPASTIAERMEVDAGNFARLETGQTNPTINTVVRLAEAMGVEVDVTVRAK